MIQVEEQGRQLRIVVGGEDEFLIPPQDSRAGATLLAGYLGVLSGLFGDLNEATTDLVRVSLGEPVFKDPAHPTERETERKAVSDALFERVQELRADEVYQVTQAAFFWQTQGGIDAVNAFVEGGVDGYPKALEILAAKSGLEIIVAQASTGNSSESETGPTEPPATSTPSPSATLSKLPPAKRSIRQNKATHL